MPQTLQRSLTIFFMVHIGTHCEIVVMDTFPGDSAASNYSAEETQQFFLLAP